MATARWLRRNHAGRRTHLRRARTCTTTTTATSSTSFAFTNATGRVRGRRMSIAPREATPFPRHGSPLHARGRVPPGAVHLTAGAVASAGGLLPCVRCTISWPPCSESRAWVQRSHTHKQRWWIGWGGCRQAAAASPISTPPQHPHPRAGWQRTNRCFNGGAQDDTKKRQIDTVAHTSRLIGYLCPHACSALPLS